MYKCSNVVMKEAHTKKAKMIHREKEEEKEEDKET